VTEPIRLHSVGPRRRIFSKGADQSTSLLGQLLHDREPRKFDVFDMDCVVWKSEYRCLRYFEEKLPGEDVSKAQSRNLGMLALMIKIAVAVGVLKDGGVWLVRFDTDCVEDVTDDSPIKIAEVKSTPYVMGEWAWEQATVGTYPQFRPLFTGEPWL
jgi:hypothetical protein